MPDLKTIAVTPPTKQRLDAAKLVPTETYEGVIVNQDHDPHARPRRRP